MKESNDDNLEKLFRDRFSDEETPVSGRVWENVRKSLPKESADKGGEAGFIIKSPLKFSLFSVAGILATGTLLYVLLSGKGTENSVKDTSSQVGYSNQQKQSANNLFITSAEDKEEISSQQQPGLQDNEQISEESAIVTDQSAKTNRTMNSDFKNEGSPESRISRQENSGQLQNKGTYKKEEKGNSTSANNKGTRISGTGSNTTAPNKTNKENIRTDKQIVQREHRNTNITPVNPVSVNSKPGTEQTRQQGNIPVANTNQEKVSDETNTTPVESNENQNKDLVQNTTVANNNNAANNKNNNTVNTSATPPVTDNGTENRNLIQNTTSPDDNNTTANKATGTNTSFTPDNKNQDLNTPDSPDKLVVKSNETNNTENTGNPVGTNDSTGSTNPDVIAKVVSPDSAVVKDTTTVQQPDSVSQATGKKEKKKTNLFSGRLSIDLFVMPALTGATTVATSDQYGPLAAEKNSQDHNRFLLGGGVALNYMVSPRFYISTGLSYSSSSESLHYKRDNVRTNSFNYTWVNDTVQVQVIDSNGTHFEDSIFQVKDDSTRIRRTFEDKKNDRYTFLSIPVHLSYYLMRKGKFALSVSAGIRANILIKGTTYVVKPDETGLEEADDKFTKLTLAWSGALGLEYNIRKNMNILLQPSFSYNTGSVHSKSFSISQKPYSFGVNAGLRIRF